MPSFALARRRLSLATDAIARHAAPPRLRRPTGRRVLAVALLALGAAGAALLLVPRASAAQRRAPPRTARAKTPPRAATPRVAATAPAKAPPVAVPVARAMIVIPALPPMLALSGDLTGIVSDSTGIAIPAAEVLVVARGIVVYTDDDGAFRLPHLPPGDHELRVRRIGFHPRTRVLSTQAGESWQLLIALDPAPAVLTAVDVKANVGLGKMAAFERRRHGNVGVFITRDQIAARKAMLLSDIMRTMPGVTMARYRSEDKVQMRPAPLGGRFDCSPDFYVDGLFVPGLDINTIPPADVQGIELYRGPSDTPVDFRSMNAPCGVVAIWTRDPQDKRQLP